MGGYDLPRLAARFGFGGAYSGSRSGRRGLSSQAMVFNLVGPLIVRKDLEPLRAAIELSGMAWPTGKVTEGFDLNLPHGPSP